jgi:hypothetical protein
MINYLLYLINCLDRSQYLFYVFFLRTIHIFMQLEGLRWLE